MDILKRYNFVTDKYNIKLYHLFIVAIILAILTVRLVSYLTAHPYINAFEIKIFYFYIGLMLLLVFSLQLIFLKTQFLKRLICVLGFALGMVTDQLLFLVGEEAEQWGYWDSPSIIGAIIAFLLISVVSYFFMVITADNDITKKIKNFELMKLYFFIFFFFLFVFLPRVFVYVFPDRSFILLGHEIHHLYSGIILLIISLFFILPSYKDSDHEKKSYLIIQNKRYKFGIIVFSIGYGLIVDQYVFRLLGGITDHDYWSSPSFFGAIFFTITFLVLAIILYILNKKRTSYNTR